MLDVAIYSPKYWANVFSLMRTLDGLGLGNLYVIKPRCQIPKKGTISFKDKDKPPYNKVRFLDSIEEFTELVKGRDLVSIELDPESQPLQSFVWGREPVAILGAEDSGVPQQLLAISRKVQVPMCGVIPCMNVACAGSIVMYDYKTKMGGVSKFE